MCIGTIFCLFYSMFKILSLSVSFLLLLLQKPEAQPQDLSESDDYFVTFEEQLTTRLYLSKKQTSFVMQGPEGIQSLRYRPNTLTSMGINASYKSLSLSFGYGFPFLNPNKDEKGKTRSFDFQTHLYTRHWVTDIYLQFYKGYYFSLGGPEGTADKYYYTRPDVKVSLVGTSVYRLLNGERFSYRAGFSPKRMAEKISGIGVVGRRNLLRDRKRRQRTGTTTPGGLLSPAGHQANTIIRVGPRSRLCLHGSVAGKFLSYR
jgi:hypothetical protein